MRRGFTLLEVLVAGIVLSIGLLGGMEVIARCASTSRQMEARERGLLFARSKLEEVLKEPTLQEGTQNGEGMDGEENPEFRWQVNVSTAGATSAGPNSDAASTLLLVDVLATHQGTGVITELTALRRADLTPPEATTTTGTGTTTGTNTGTGTTGAGGGQ